MLLRLIAGCVAFSIFGGCFPLTQPSHAPVPDPSAVALVARSLHFDPSGETLFVLVESGGRCEQWAIQLSDRTIRDPGLSDSCAPADIQGLRQARRLGDGTVLGVRRTTSGDSLIRLGTHSETELVKARLIDSYDIAPGEKEIVISANTGGGLDVGIIPMAGGEVRWIFPDPLPERLVTWAPRGSKVSYVVESPGGTIIRTVHVPTSYQLSIDLPLGTVSAMAWEPKAEKFAVALSSIDRSPRIDLMRYGGEERETLTGGTETLSVAVDRINAAVVTAPSVTRYGQRYPVIVWVSEGSPYTWNEARAKVARRGEIGSAVVSSGALTEDFWSGLNALSWVDPEKLFLVQSGSQELTLRVPTGSKVTVIGPSREKNARPRIGERQVILPYRSNDVFELAAADYILNVLKK